MVEHAEEYGVDLPEAERAARERMTGEIRAAFSLSEPETGSDVQGIKGGAKQDADGNWVLNGQKTWVTFAKDGALLVSDERILVQVVRNKVGQIFSMNLDGADAREFTRASSSARTMRWVPRAERSWSAEATSAGAQARARPRTDSRQRSKDSRGAERSCPPSSTASCAARFIAAMASARLPRLIATSVMGMRLLMYCRRSGRSTATGWPSSSTPRASCASRPRTTT